MASAEAERKLTAVFVTDVVGYSRLMGDDHDATVNTLSDYRAVFSDYIQQHKGSGIQFRSSYPSWPNSSGSWPRWIS